MISWVTQVLVASSLLDPTAQGFVSYAKTIPPMPNQSVITCHDTAWEKQNLRNIDAFQLHAKLKPFIQNMITDAQTEGAYITLTSAYRTCTEQASLRAYACGTGDYNMNIKPIKDCHPPTEPAGKSLHNEGLAVDLACAGYGMFETSPCYKWLKVNHVIYALFEHELEPWHWSTTGK